MSKRKLFLYIFLVAAILLAGGATFMVLLAAKKPVARQKAPKVVPMASWPEDGYPINVVIVELPDAGGVHLVSSMIDCKPEDIKVGMPVKAVFEDITEQVSLPKFRPT